MSEPAPARPPRSLKRSFASLVLVGEVLVVGFAALVARSLADVGGPTLAVVTAALVVLCLLAAGLLRSSAGYALGWLVQVLLVLSGIWVPLMFFLGAGFALLWWVALRTGARADAETARRQAAR